MDFNPALEDMGTYPFVALAQAKQRVEERLGSLIDFGVGNPMETTPTFIRRALVDSIPDKASYPRAAGLPEAREAIAEWYRTRFGVDVDPDVEVLPSTGSKEAIFSLAQIAVDRDATRNLVVTTEPGYPIPSLSARLNGAEVLTLPLLESRGFLPDLDALGDETWARVALFWVNYPNNPTGAVASPSFFDELASKARTHGFLIASDEAYSEIYFGAPPHSALEFTDRGHVIVFNTLSKRSAMAGYRSGSIVGGERVMSLFKRYRPMVGTASPEFVQRAAVAAWRDEEHVEAMRDLYRAKRSVIEPFLVRKGLHIAASEATFFLWVAVPEGETEQSFAMRLLDNGVVVGPGSLFGPAGAGYVRIALVPTLEQCHEAVSIMDALL